MKTRVLSTVLAVASLTALSQTVFAEEINQEKLQLLPVPTQASNVDAAAAITYNPDLTNTSLTHGAGIPGATDKNNIYNSATWDYYRFCANPGATVTIQVDRTTYDMDPAMQICQGVIADSAGVSPFGGCGSAGPFIGWADDDNGIPHNVGGWWGDPILTFTAPAGSTPNEFTLMVMDFDSAGPNPQFEMHVSGTSPCVLPVTIDIKPGSDPNSINLCSEGAVPVAIMGSATFDVNSINTDTLRLADAAVKMVGKKDPKSLCNTEDVNADGYEDLVCHFNTTELGNILDGTSTSATVKGETVEGTPIEGSDSIVIVKDGCE
jgi:hypothetical protein